MGETESNETTGMGSGPDLYKSLGAESAAPEGDPEGAVDKNVHLTLGYNGELTGSELSYTDHATGVAVPREQSNGPEMVTGNKNVIIDTETPTAALEPSSNIRALEAATSRRVTGSPGTESQSAPDEASPTARDAGELIKLPAYNYVGGRHASPSGAEAGSAYAEYITATQGDARIELPAPEKEKSVERLEQVNSILTSIENHAKILGLDVSDRLPASDKVHYFEPEEYKAVRSLFNTHQDTHGQSASNGEVFVEDLGNEAEAAAIAQHEILHGASYQELRTIGTTAEDLRTIYQRQGYGNQRNGMLKAFNEVMLEMTNIEVMRTQWPNHESLRGLAEPSHGYEPAMIVVEGMIGQAAAVSGGAFRDTLHDLQRGMFTGDSRQLKIFTDTLGQESLTILARLDPGKPRSREEWTQIATDIGSQGAVDKLGHYFDNDEIVMLDQIDHV